MNGSYPAGGWVYDIAAVGRQVFIVTYGCHLGPRTPEPVVSAEHREIGEFTEAEVPGLVMPEGYKASVASWFAMLRGSRTSGAHLTC
jgi:hypothetical protein